MQEKIENVSSQFEEEVALLKTNQDFEDFRIRFFGRKGIFTGLFEEFKSLPVTERPKYGKLLNELKNSSANKFESLKKNLKNDLTVKQNTVDVTLPGRLKESGTIHVLMQTLMEMKSFFQGLGFDVYEGPELESEYNNFEALNFPEDHPARDMQDTFFVNKDFLFRTHTSPVQVRLMSHKKPPIRAIMPGKVYRNEALSAKSYCLFHQVEGLYIDTHVTFSELKGTLIAFTKHFFGPNVKYRFRSSFFPFTEPSAEVDIWWQPKGKPGKWLEILGCGMVDPNVLIEAGIDPEIYTGYAFGMGVERIALRKYGINDIRLFFDNDKRFLTQF